MLLDIHGHGLSLDEAVRERVHRRLWFALGRLKEHVGQVSVYLTDVNGPRGGEDKRCRVVVDVLGHDQVVVEDTDCDVQGAIDRAADRVGQAVRRKLDRVQTVRRYHTSEIPDGQD